MEKELKQDMSRLVDLMITAEAARDAIAEQKKHIKSEYEIAIPLITKIATILRKDALDEEEEKWNEIKNLVTECK